jgi:hypothetical protein
VLKIAKIDVIGFLFLAPSLAFATAGKYGGELNDYNMGSADAVYQKLTEAQAAAVNIMSNCNCSLPYLPVGENPKCRKAYENLYDKPVVNMKIVLGYADVQNPPRPYSIDPIFHASLVKKMTEKNCEPNDNLCGFQQARDNAEKFFKRINGPDGKPRTVVIHLVRSSYTTRRDLNEKYADIQESYSEHAEKTLLDFKDTAVTMFVGHARTTCGLGTHIPPIRNNEAGQPVDVDYAQECQRGTMDKIAAALEQNRPKLFSQIVCGSNPAMPKLLAKYPGMASQSRVTGHLGWVNDWPYQVYGTLNGLLGQVCEPTLSQMINPNVVDPRGHLQFKNFQ